MRAKTLNCGHPAQGSQTVRRECSKGTPGAFELVDPNDQAQDLWRDVEGIGAEHRTNNAPNQYLESVRSEI
jgi:hypothetical protein